MAKHGLLDELLGDIEATYTASCKARKMAPSLGPAASKPKSPPKAPPPLCMLDDVVENDNGLQYRDDDRTVSGPCLSAASLTQDIPKPTAAYKVLKKLEEPGARVMPFEYYWFKNTKLVTLDMSLPVHVLALYMVELHKTNRGMDKLIRPFVSLVRSLRPVSFLV